MEHWVDDIIGPEGTVEFKETRAKLGDTQTNRVFVTFGIEVPMHLATQSHLVAEKKKKTALTGGGGPATGCLEKKKRQHTSFGASHRSAPASLGTLSRVLR